MLKQFLNHIDEHKLCTRADKVLLAVSGGVDSMVMFNLFKQAGFAIGVAHCNFQLRGDESNRDEIFIETACEIAKVCFHPVRFETEQFASEHGISIQMAARDLRYRFFEELRVREKYTHVATAHHLNDNLETVLLNLVRGTGLEGLTGIAVKQGNLIRPMLFAMRSEIETYAAAEKLTWREDSSNSSDGYHRNLLRNQVVPVLKKINPSLENRFEETLQRIKGAWSLAQDEIERFRQSTVQSQAGQLRIDRTKLRATTWPAVLLWELIKDKGFNYEQCRSVTSGSHASGKLFYSKTHQLTIDRQDLIVSVQTNADEAEVMIFGDQEHIYHNEQHLKIETIDSDGFTIDKMPEIAQLDLDVLHFPLTWRRWKAGDQFIPLGMKQSKKLSDFLIDAKVPLPDKDRVTVLESANSIVWVVGWRISDTVKVTNRTKRIIKITKL